MDIAVLFLTSVVILGILTLQSHVSRAERTIARVERKLDLVLQHLDLHEEIPGKDGIVALVREGKTVQAVKAYREATGAGLLEAKQAVDRLT
ncbi:MULTISPECIES: hypothetical protein [Streptomyces]|uniref:Ribosomal protein L7/L12 C-terminal domain-containing protein n=1 Tax=Streptomyces hirsutus TaxID=35620 RepID=A0ABZ1GN28_9ACTN|nr:hypothetical protein [Streptomyces hirsutus]WSD07589.1 hypothetical protein OIE73_18795 [Streptomyces hirsutus]WTD18981.1 hypothetical protein OH738_20795 [Streptomyces hirsutus]WTD76088.1 hypothetical protein OHB56_20690 [Streptomyces sp. NBC_01635]